MQTSRLSHLQSLVYPRDLCAGMRNEAANMLPAPYKVSDPTGAEKVKSIDAAALRKESWILGQCPGTYASIQKNSFASP